MSAHAITSTRRRGQFLAVALAALICASVLAVVKATEAAGASYTGVVSDGFDRSVASGWGSSGVGAYTVGAPAGVSVNVAGSTGRISALPAGKSASVVAGGVSERDVHTRAAFVVDTAATVTTYQGLEARRQGDGSTYRAKAVVNGASVSLDVARVQGKVETSIARAAVPGISARQGTTLWLALEVTGTDKVAVSAKAWVAGTTEPGWQATKIDDSASRISAAGAAGVWVYLSSGANRAATFAVDELQVLRVTTTPPVTTPPVTTPPVTTPPVTTPPVTTPPVTTPPVTTPPVTTPPVTTPPVTTPPVTPPGSSTTPTGEAIPAATVSGAGAALPGATSYPIPSGAIYVATNGNDAAAGTAAAPKKTVTAAIRAATSGSSIVLRAGSYHETVAVPAAKQLVIQSYPGEAVWLDGTRAVSGWQRSGTSWVAPWTIDFDSSPTFYRGAADGTSAHWQFVNPARPMAAHPDQVWINGAMLTQVSSVALVTAGTFYVDKNADRMYVGTDPTGKSVRASALNKALSVAAPSTVVRGIGISGYAPSVPDMGAVQITGRWSTLENVLVLDSATIAVSASGPDISLNRVTIARAGMMGVHGHMADRLQLRNSLVVDSNREGFNPTPAAGGLKITRTRGITLDQNEFRANDGASIWVDESSYSVVVTRNRIHESLLQGIVLEISSEVFVADNLVTSSVAVGIHLKNVGHAEVWNNTVIGGNRLINITQDSRIASDLSLPGHDTRRPLPDPTVTWLTGPTNVANNVLIKSSGNALLGMEDWTRARSASAAGVWANGNVYQKASATSPTWATVWARQGTDPAVYTQLGAFQSGAGQEAAGFQLPYGTDAVSLGGWPTAAVSARNASAVALPQEVATLIGKPAGTRGVGTWVRSN